jgi:hypothetical protein
VVSLKNTIVANSPSGGNCNGAISSLGHNLSSDGSCALSQSTDQSDKDPLLGPLQLNAPGATPTHALLNGSPALDKADNATCAAAPVSGRDQRGVLRPQALRCDIGAFEAVRFLVFLPTLLR